MKVVILAGGLGTRISEESHLKPKPMIEIGGSPILWHILKIYSHYGYNDFIICCGYKGYLIKEYFADYYLHRSDITFDFSDNNKMIIHNNIAEPWRVTLVDTGMHSQTGARIRKVQKYVDGQPFMMTYGDGVSDLNINQLVSFHEKQKTLATLTAVQPGGRFGVLKMGDGSFVEDFEEKSKEGGGWINAGFMVMEPEIFKYLDDREDLVFEREPLEQLAREAQLTAYQYDGFWRCMDTLRDKNMLEELWNSGQAPWKIWK